jgi:hypothetical protein
MNALQVLKGGKIFENNPWARGSGIEGRTWHLPPLARETVQSLQCPSQDPRPLPVSSVTLPSEFMTEVQAREPLVTSRNLEQITSTPDDNPAPL